MQIKEKIVAVVFALAALSALAGCTPAEPTPSPTPVGATPAVRSNDPSVLNNPNVPEEIKRQIRGGGAPPK